MKEIPDKAEVDIDFPDKTYMGSFGRHARYEARADAESMRFKLVSSGDDRREAEIHLHHFLFAALLDELAASLAKSNPIDDVHREAVRDAAYKLYRALGGS